MIRGNRWHADCPKCVASKFTCDEHYRECPNSPDGRHQVDTSMESGPNNCFHCEAPMPDTYRGWSIARGRWPEPAWNATSPNYDAWTEGEGEWADNGEKANAPTREALIEEIDAWFEEHAA